LASHICARPREEQCAFWPGADATGDNGAAAMS